jgi:Glyoxalase-like domain
MGTHNALAQLGDEKFLEIPAIDPEAERPKRPRWFGLDMPDVQEALTARASDDFSDWFDAPEDVRAQAARRSTSPR